MPTFKEHHILKCEVNTSFTQKNLAWILQEVKGRNIFEDSPTVDKGCIKIKYGDVQILVQFPLQKLLSKTAYRQQQSQSGFGVTNTHVEVHAYTISSGDEKKGGMLYRSDALETGSKNDTSPAILEVEHIPDVYVGLNYILNKPAQHGFSAIKSKDEEKHDFMSCTGSVSSNSDSSLWESSDEDNESALTSNFGPILNHQVSKYFIRTFTCCNTMILVHILFMIHYWFSIA